MANRQVCVYRAATLEEADIVVAWLGTEGVKAEVPYRYSIGMLPWGTPTIGVGGGIAVLVPSEHAEQAVKLLKDQDNRVQRLKQPGDDSTITVVCEDCRRSSTFADPQWQRVERCPHCKHHIDVGGVDAGDDAAPL